MTDISNSPYVKKSRAQSLRMAILTLVVGLLLTGGGGYLLSGAISEASRSFEEVQVTATAEFTDQQATGSRRNKRIEDVRMVTVSMPDGTSKDMRSDSLQIGETTTAYLSDDGVLRETEPDAPGFWRWALAVGLTLVGLATLAGFVGSLRKRNAMGRITDDASRLALEITAIADDTIGKRQVRKITATVQESTATDTRVGDTVVLTAGVDAVPAELARALEARIIRETQIALLAAVRSIPNGDWWTADAVNESAVERSENKSGA